MRKILLLLLLSSNLFALDITVDEAKNMALKNSDKIRMVRNNKEMSENTYSDAFSNALPKIDASLTYMRNVYSPEIPNQEYYLTQMANGQIQHTNYHSGMAQAMQSTTDPYYNVPQMDTVALGDKNIDAVKNNDINFGVTVVQPIWTGGKVFSALRIADHYKEMSEYQYEGSVDSISTEVEKSFYTVLMLKESVNIIKNIQALTNKHLKMVDDLVKAGLASEYDLLKAKIAIRQIEPKVLELENGLKLAGDDLKIKMGVSFDEDVNTLGMLEVDSNFSIDGDYYALVKKNSKTLKVLEKVSKMREENIIIEKADFQPTVAAVLAYNFIAKNDDITNTFSSGSDEFDAEEGMNFVNVGINVSIPIFSGGSTVAKTANAKIEYENSLIMLGNVEKMFKLQIENCVNTINKNVLKLDIQEDVVIQSKKALEIADVTYKNGRGTQLDYFDAQSAYEAATLELMQIKLELKLAQIDYRYYTGQVTK